MVPEMVRIFLKKERKYSGIIVRHISYLIIEI